jgi:hypothetical protein
VQISFFGAQWKFLSVPVCSLLWKTFEHNPCKSR